MTKIELADRAHGDTAAEKLLRAVLANVRPPTLLADYRVLFALKLDLVEGQFQPISQSDLAARVGMKRSNLNRALKRLTAGGKIVAGPRVGIHRSYRLPPII